MVVAAGVLTLHLHGAFQGLEYKSLDERFRWRGEKPPFRDIVIVAIDEPSIQALGRWPWPRSIHARLVDLLTKHGARVIAFDVLFTEPDSSGKSSDAAFADAIRRSGRVVLNSFFDDVDSGEPTVHRPLPSFAGHAQVGFANVSPEFDGVSRKIPLVIPYQSHLEPSFAAAVLSLYRNQPVERVLNAVPSSAVEDTGKMLLNFRGGYQTFPYISYAEALEGRPSRKDFYQGKIVLIGGTATALFDHLPIPFAPLFPGVEIQATAVDNLITGSYLKALPKWVGVLEIAGAAFLMGLCLPFLGPWAGALLAVGVIGGLLAADVSAFSKFFLAADFVAPATTCLACYVGVLFYRLVTEEREKRWIKSTFSQYLSPKVITLLVQDPARLKLGGEEREISILFSDIEHFTTASEQLGTAPLVEFLNQYLTLMSDVILKHDGVVDKYVGDAIMAFWNAPLDQGDHARLACSAALECQAVLRKFREEFKSRLLPPVFSRIGINTGPAKVGNMGSKTRLSYTAIGDSVNLASRLEGANKVFGTYLMISETTYEKVQGGFECRELDKITVVGKRRPIRVYELMARKGELTEHVRKGLECYEEALHLYFPGRQFAKAKERFRQVFDFIPNDPVAQVYVERCELFSVQPPAPDWDGVSILTSK